MRRSRGLGRVLTALAAAGGMAVAAAPTAQAVTYAQPVCESGGGKFHCSINHDGVAPLTIRWSFDGYDAPWLDDRTFTGWRACGTPTPSVSVTVSDLTGSATGTRSFSCNYGPWQ